MRLAIGIIVSSGYRCETDFLFGRADCPHEGLYALKDRLTSGEANRHLPDDLKVSGVRLILSRKFPTDVARNEICAEALKGGEDYLLFLDADNVHPSTLPEQLMAARKDVITARYHLKKPPFNVIAYVKHRTQEGPHRYAAIHFGRGVFEIERGGAGALLIHRSVLQDIQARIGHNWFRYQRADDAAQDFTVSEDFWFYQQARETGHSCWIDWECECPHLGTMPIDGSWNGPFLHQHIGDYETPELRDVVLKNTIIRGYPEGLYLGDHNEHHVPEYQVTAGER